MRHLRFRLGSASATGLQASRETWKTRDAGRGVCVSEGDRETGAGGSIWDMADAVSVGGKQRPWTWNSVAWEAKRGNVGCSGAVELVVMAMAAILLRS